MVGLNFSRPARLVVQAVGGPSPLAHPGSVMWEKVPPVTALLQAGDWPLKLPAISAIVGPFL